MDHFKKMTVQNDVNSALNLESVAYEGFPSAVSTNPNLPGRQVVLPFNPNHATTTGPIVPGALERVDDAGGLGKIVKRIELTLRAAGNPASPKIVIKTPSGGAIENVYLTFAGVNTGGNYLYYFEATA